MCEICGHEFGTTQAIPRARLEETEAAARPRPRRPNPGVTHQPAPRRQSVMARVPWGVIGVLAVIAFVVVGAMLLAEHSGLTQTSAEPTVEILFQESADPEDGVIVVTAQLATPPTSTSEPPTATPAPSPTPVPPIEYTVQAGDTCGGIAQRFGIGLGTLAAANNLDTNTCLIRVGDKLIIPVPTPTPVPTETLPPGAPPPTTGPVSAEPTVTRPAQIVHVVKGGETCLEIAQRYNVPLESLMQQNNLDSNCLIRINQVLTVTFATPTPFLSPTPFILQTPTPRAGYSAPSVILPQDDAQISGTQEIVTLQWLTVGLLQQDEWYVVQVQPSGAITVPIFETKATSLKLTQDILGDWQERDIAWWVQVKRFVGIEPGTGQRIYVEISPPSAVRSFVWRKRPESTATPGQ